MINIEKVDDRSKSKLNNVARNEKKVAFCTLRL